MRLWLAASSVILLGCVADADRDKHHGPDDPECASPQTFFEDRDGDGHGDAALTVSACEQPEGAVPAGDDCDDANVDRHPGAIDICDGIDNDCNASSADACPSGCTALRGPAAIGSPHVYLFCTNEIPWVTASVSCANAGPGFRLAEIDTQAENTFIRENANMLLGPVDIHIGANDREVEDSWVWEGGELFWTGGPGGAAFNGRFEAWAPGAEPNAADGTDPGSDCGELRTDNRWYDSNCGDTQRYVCRL